MTCSLSRYNVKGELDCFNCKTGVFSDFSLQSLQKTAITIHVSAKKATHLWRIFNYYREKLSVPTVHNAALIESRQQHHNASVQLNIGEQ